AGFADAVQLEATWRNIIVEWPFAQTTAMRVDAPTAPGAFNVDLGGGASSITQAAIDAFTPARPRVAWEGGGRSFAHGGTVVEMKWSSGTGASVVHGTWTLVVPPDTNDVFCPKLPETASDWTPAKQATFAPPHILAVTSKALATNAEFRAISA